MCYLDKVESMKVFLRVAELASFTKAAQSLALPKATISVAIQQLESHLGTQLFHRTTRRVQLTQDGRTFYERCIDLLSDVDEVENMFKKNPGKISGRIRVDMSTGFARNLIVPNLKNFIKLHPHIEVELSSTDRKVDIIREGFDCVLRVGSLQESGLIAKHLGVARIVNCASPEYIKEFGRPKNLADLSNHYLVHYVSTLGAKPDGFEYHDGENYKMHKMQGKIVVNNADAYTAACLAGLGIIQAPLIGVRDYFKSGQMVEVLPRLVSGPMPVNLVYPNRRNLALRVRVFMDWMSELVKESLK